MRRGGAIRNRRCERIQRIKEAAKRKKKQKKIKRDGMYKRKAEKPAGSCHQGTSLSLLTVNKACEHSPFHLFSPFLPLTLPRFTREALFK